MPSGAQLARLACVVDRVALRQDLRGLVLEVPQRVVQGPNGHPAELHGVELLEAVERARMTLFLIVAMEESATSWPSGPVT